MLLLQMAVRIKRIKVDVTLSLSSFNPRTGSDPGYYLNPLINHPTKASYPGLNRYFQQQKRYWDATIFQFTQQTTKS